MKFMSLVLAATAGTLAAGVCQALPGSVFGPIYLTVNNPCAIVPGDKAGKGPEAVFGEIVHFTISGKVVSVLDSSGGAPSVKFTMETHGEGMGATTGASYIFDDRVETMANPPRSASADSNANPNANAGTKAGDRTANGTNTIAPDEKLQFDNVYKISARIRSGENSDPARDNATIEFPIKLSYIDGTTVAWPLNAQDNIRLTCQAAP